MAVDKLSINGLTQKVMAKLILMANAGGASNIWYKEWQADIKNGLWKDIPYCAFIDMFNYDIEDLGNDESEEIYEVHLDWMMERAVEEDNEQFGKADYRVHLTGILLSELGDTVLVDQSPENH